MHLTVILRVTGTLLTLFSFAFLLPVVVALLYGEKTLSTFFCLCYYFAKRPGPMAAAAR